MKALIYNTYHSCVCVPMWWVVEGAAKCQRVPFIGDWLYSRVSLLEHRAIHVCLKLDDWVVDKED